MEANTAEWWKMQAQRYKKENADTAKERDIAKHELRELKKAFERLTDEHNALLRDAALLVERIAILTPKPSEVQTVVPAEEG